jgi:hypothetical protein
VYTNPSEAATRAPFTVVPAMRLSFGGSSEQCQELEDWIREEGIVPLMRDPAGAARLAAPHVGLYLVQDAGAIHAWLHVKGWLPRHDEEPHRACSNCFHHKAGHEEVPPEDGLDLPAQTECSALDEHGEPCGCQRFLPAPAMLCDFEVELPGGDKACCSQVVDRGSRCEQHALVLTGADA